MWIGVTSHTCYTNEDSEAEADQEHHEDQDKMSFGQGVEPHGGQSVTGRHTHNVNTHTHSKQELLSVVVFAL